MQEFPLHMQNFLTYLETIRGKSSLTVDEYALDLRMFFRFLKRERGLVSPSLPFEQIPIDDVDESLLTDCGPGLGISVAYTPHRAEPFPEEMRQAGRRRVAEAAARRMVQMGIW